MRLASDRHYEAATGLSTLTIARRLPRPSGRPPPSHGTLTVPPSSSCWPAKSPVPC
ncbi:hypothetical protein [Streptomyces sp. NPDC095602]|uniref:hypothetical protein n=1 Tax=Streptomyces sp. NPDC095602 TaxID=3155819 RepID=UPI0033319D5F